MNKTLLLLFICTQLFGIGCGSKNEDASKTESVKIAVTDALGDTANKVIRSLQNFYEPTDSAPAKIILAQTQKVHIFAYRFSTSSTPQNTPMSIQVNNNSTWSVNDTTNTKDIPNDPNSASVLPSGNQSAYYKLETAGSFYIKVKSNGTELSKSPYGNCDMHLPNRSNLYRFITTIYYHNQTPGTDGIVVIIMNNIL